MTSTEKSLPRRIVSRAARLWAELDYAQRRVFEIRTGVPVTSERRRRRGPGAVRELESHLYEYDGPPEPC